MKDLDSLALELAKASRLNKVALPPKVYSKMRQWLKRIKSARVRHLKDVIAQKAEDIRMLQSLAKNEVMASFYDSGVMKMDFGAEVGDRIKKAALRWARKRGLKVIEASLAKSDGSPSTYVLNVTEDHVPYGRCVKRMKWSV